MPPRPALHPSRGQPGVAGAHHRTDHRKVGEHVEGEPHLVHRRDSCAFGKRQFAAFAVLVRHPKRESVELNFLAETIDGTALLAAVERVIAICLHGL
jgi:hypothetical protein